MIAKQRLFTPGPTPLHPAVQEALAQPIRHHRTEEFRAVVGRCARGLQAFLKTTEDVLLLAASGTGAMEAAVVNVVAPGETMLALVAGNFGERWAAIGRAYGMNVKTLAAEWGSAVPATAVERALRDDPTIRAVFCQHSESSTGVRHDVQALARLTAAAQDTLLVVDAISSAGAMPLETAAWGLDVVVVGSQKALSIPPGLVFLTLSPKAWARVESVLTPRFYFDLRRERKAQAGGEPSSFTPPIAHVMALQAALQHVEASGGVDALVRNAALLAGMTRAALGALGLALVAPQDHGDALTAFHPPAGVDSAAVVKSLKAGFGATIAGGQGQLKGKIGRIAHLGYYDALDILGLLAALEIVLLRLGHRFELGCGVAAAQRALADATAS